MLTRLVSSLPIGLVLVTLAPRASAQGLPPARPVVHDPFDLRFEGNLGVTSGAVPSGVLAGAAFHAAYRYFQLGASLQGGAEFVVLGNSRSLSSLAAAAGLCLHSSPTGRRVRVDVLLTGGVHNYAGFGGYWSLFGSSWDGVKASLGFLGGRVGVAYESAGPRRFTVGLSAWYEADLTTATAYEPPRPSSGVPGLPPPMASTAPIVIGGHLMGAHLTMGVAWELDGQ